jgi:SAM-dependent methyltransferase
MGQDIREYYDRRAKESEEIYTLDDPVRQAAQMAIADALRLKLAGRRVLEIACGTGYWTAVLAESAEHILATDASAEMMEIARAKPIPPEKVEFRIVDAYGVDELAETFDAAVAMFWLSHVPKERMHAFLEQLHARLAPDSVVFLADNVFMPGVGGELIRPPGSIDTFKRRTLRDGSQHEIVKNYYDADELRALVKPWASDAQVHIGTCFWTLIYRFVSRRKQPGGM